jgi:preprotein translocase subunit SecD
MVVPHWPRIGLPSPTDHPVTLTFRVASPAAPQLLEETRRILERRATALELGHAHASILDDHTLALETGKAPDDATLAALSAPGRFEARMVLKSFSLPFIPSSLGREPTPGKPASTLDGVIAKLGDAYPAALALKRPDPNDSPQLQAFHWLTPDEVSLLPAQMQFNVSSISCGQLYGRRNALELPANAQVTVCVSDSEKLLLDRVALTGSDIASASVHVTTEAGLYGVSIVFTNTGSPKWTELTRSASSGQSCEPGDGVHCRVALSVDGNIISAPMIMGTLSGSADISSFGTKSVQHALAAQIGPNELPLRLELVK